jgi:hypothetical protein
MSEPFPLYPHDRKSVTTSVTSGWGQGTKSLRSSPLRGGVSRRASNKPIIY